MKKFLKFRYISSAILLLFLILQLFRIDKKNPPSTPGCDFLQVVQPPAEIAAMIKTGCYDCHSNETVYPWYSNIAPVSWLLKSHISEGREQINFSEWGNYQPGKRGHKLDECKEMVEKGEMPLSGYTLLHPAAKFSPEQRETLKIWLTNK
jgi:hypothetical protein